jgi:hypothetical protein
VLPAGAAVPPAGAAVLPAGTAVLPGRESRLVRRGNPVLGLDIRRSLSINGLILNHSLHRWQISVGSAPGLFGPRPT